MRRNMKRTAKVDRKTKETDIRMTLNLDGTGRYVINTTIPFLDHMLSLMCKHGSLDMRLTAKGDTDVDDHHTVEDIGIVMGRAFKKAMGDMKGINRYGHASVPMDEAIARVSLDMGGRPYLVYKVAFSKKIKIKKFEVDLIEDFFIALIGNSGMTLHIECPYGRNTHHIIEALFKAVGRSIRHAVSIDPREKGVPSTKGVF
jgi:imidazoleglycerol-phosphate dehydratase